MTSKRTLSILLTCLTFIMVINVTVSRDNFAPPGRTGAPGENSCGVGTTGCHNSLALQSQLTGDLILETIQFSGALALDDNFEYTHDSTYLMSFTIANPSARTGFSLTTLDANNSFVGSFTIPAGSGAEIRSSAPLGRDYVGHTNTLGANSWDFEWTAPSAGTGDVTIYASANKSNNNGATSNDSIIAFELTISEKDTTTIPSSIYGAGLLSNEFSILNNPISSSNVMIELEVKEPSSFTFEFYSLTGQLIQAPITQVYHGGFELINLPINTIEKGIYILKLSDSEGKFATEKVLIL